jgi:hypothetical protein
MKMLRYLLTLTVITFLMMPAASDAKGTEKALGTFGNWRAYASNDDKRPVCSMALAQRIPATKGFKRGASYLMITHRPTEGSTDVVSYISGYNFKTGSDAKAHVGTVDFDMFTQDNTAWTREASTDHKLAAAIRSHDSLIFTGTPAAKGMAVTTDKLNLKGSADAYRAIGKACGIKTEAPMKPKAKTKAMPAKKPAKPTKKIVKKP